MKSLKGTTKLPWRWGWGGVRREDKKLSIPNEDSLNPGWKKR